jgi:hypothetical protein
LVANSPATPCSVVLAPRTIQGCQPLDKTRLSGPRLDSRTSPPSHSPKTRASPTTLVDGQTQEALVRLAVYLEARPSLPDNQALLASQVFLDNRALALLQILRAPSVAKEACLVPVARWASSSNHRMVSMLTSKNTLIKSLLLDSTRALSKSKWLITRRILTLT